MKSTWCQLWLTLVLLCCDGGSYESVQKYYIGYGGENLNESTDETKRAMDMRNDMGRKREQDSGESETNHIKGITESANARKLRSSGNGFHYFPGLSLPNELLRVGADEKRPPIDLQQRVKSEREITPSYSISSDKYHVNISCHVAFKRSCALPDAAFIFKQMAFNDEVETTVNCVGTEDVMELLTFGESSVQSGITAKVNHKSPRDKHRVINVADDESKSIVKDALAFESSRVTKIWGEHGRAGPVAGDASPLHDETQLIRNQRKRRSPHWSFPYKQVIIDTGRLMTKYRALTGNGKKSKSGLGRYFEKNETESANATKVLGQRKSCGLQNKECTPFPRKGHLCHYHYKNHQDRKTHYFRHNKTSCKSTKPPHCPTLLKASTMSATVTKEDLVEPTTLGADAITSKVKNSSRIDDAESTPQTTADIGQSKKM